MDIGVASSRSEVRKNVFDEEWLEELVCVRAVSEMESHIIRPLLTVS
jgi:hypothetical protein